MRIAGPHAEALTAMPVLGAGRDSHVVSSARHATDYMFTFFLTLGQGGPSSSIHSHAQDVQEGAIPKTSPLGRRQGRKEVSR